MPWVGSEPMIPVFERAKTGKIIVLNILDSRREDKRFWTEWSVEASVRAIGAEDNSYT
jgi:hypothetical protein